MISIIICSRDFNALHRVTDSVANTIGVEHEIIAIDNKEGRYGICEAYNLGAAKSHFNVVCFMHEDIVFHTSDWGKLVIDTLADETVGVLGVAGGTYMADAPGSWNACGAEHIVMQIQHTVKGETQVDRIVPKAATLFPVAVVDGVWMCCRKNVWQENPFDSIIFPGFHFYDVDFCTRVFKSYTVCVTTNVLIEHFSRGSYTKPWYEAALTYYARRRAYLPFGSITVTNKAAKELKIRAIQQFILGYMKHGLEVGVALRMFGVCLRTSLLNRNTFWVMRQWLRSSP